MKREVCIGIMIFYVKFCYLKKSKALPRKYKTLWISTLSWRWCCPQESWTMNWFKLLEEAEWWLNTINISKMMDRRQILQFWNFENGAPYHIKSELASLKWSVVRYLIFWYLATWHDVSFTFSQFNIVWYHPADLVWL